MSLKKTTLVFSLPLFLSSILFSQNLVDYAKRERERRESLKGRKVIVVTNSDLRGLKKRPAIDVPPPSAFTPEMPPETTPPAEMAPEAAPPGTPENLSEEDAQKMIADLEEKLVHAGEYVSLLSTRLNGLWQEFYSMDDTADRSNIQREISEISQRIEMAQEQEKKIREELERLRGQIIR